MDTASLPDGLRERVEQKKGAEGVWSDGKIYLLSDRIRAGRVRKVFIHEAAHEGLRRVFGERYDDFLRDLVTEFSDGVSETARKRGIDITTAEGQLEAADEFLAKLAEERLDPEDPGERGSIWKRILYKFRAWLRRHGFDIAYSDNELTELLRDGARAVGEGEQGKRIETDENGEERFAVGDRVKMIIDKVPVENTNIALLTKSPDMENIVKKIFENFPKTVIAADGKNILLHNPQILFDKTTGEEIIESDAKRMQNRLDHLTRGGEDHNSSKLDNRKFKWLPRTPETIQNAQFKLQATNCLGYVRRYNEGFHLVLVSPDGVAYYETGIDNALVSQFKENFTGTKGDFVVVWESGRFTNSTVNRLPVTNQSGASLPVTNYNNVSPNGKMSSGDGEKNARVSVVEDKETLDKLKKAGRRGILKINKARRLIPPKFL